MRKLLSFLLIIFFFNYVCLEDVRLLDLEPNDAQNIIENKDTTLKYAPKIESNVPAVRYLGNEPHKVQEDIYLANQYHGQDGLGGYLYGYAVPDIAKTERKKAGGDLRGAYNYIAGNGQEIKVEYWDNGNGFHQIDNVPKILPKQIDDTPEVKAAKDEHQRIWNEEAERNSRPIANPYAQVQQTPQYGSKVQQTPQYGSQNLVNRYQQQKQQFPNPGQNVFYQGGQEGQYFQNTNQYQRPQAQFSYGRSLESNSQPTVGGVNSVSGQSPLNAYQENSLNGQLTGEYSQNVNQYQKPQGETQNQGSSSEKLTVGNQVIRQNVQPLSNIQSGAQRTPSGQLVGGYSQNVNQNLKPEESGQISSTTSGKVQAASVSELNTASQKNSQYSTSQPSAQIDGQYRSEKALGYSSVGQSSQYLGTPLREGFTQNQNFNKQLYSGGSNQNSQYSSNQQNSGSNDEDQSDQGNWKYIPSEEEQGPPKGFFYNFDYPVGIIVQKDGAALKDFYSSNKASFERQLQTGSSDKAAQNSNGYLVV